MGLGIKKNDTVLVIRGDEKGKKGRVKAVQMEKNRLLVESINMIKKHMKPSKKQKIFMKEVAPTFRKWIFTFI